VFIVLLPLLCYVQGDKRSETSIDSQLAYQISRGGYGYASLLVVGKRKKVDILQLLLESWQRSRFFHMFV
jgi:hypothetical protein